MLRICCELATYVIQKVFIIFIPRSLLFFFEESKVSLFFFLHPTRERVSYINININASFLLYGININGNIICL